LWQEILAGSSALIGSARAAIGADISVALFNSVYFWTSISTRP
jgi:hypothetical protein